MSRRAPGPRQARRARLKRKRRRQQGAALVGGLALCAGVIAVASWVGNSMRDRPEPSASPVATTTAVATEQDTLLLVRYGPDEGAALGVTLLAAGQGSSGNAVLFLPEGTLVDIPGFGLDRLGLAHQYGGGALLEASVENLLGIDVDHVAGISDSGLAAFLARTGGFDLEVDSQLVERTDDGAGEVRFEPGQQFLDGQRLAEYWGFRQRGESELDTFSRQQQVWTKLLAAAGEGDVMAALLAGGAPQLETSASRQFLRSVLDRLSSAQAAGNLEYISLPVTPFGAEDETGAVTYRPTTVGLEQLAAGPLAGSVPTGGGTQALRIQVLNGVGTPGIGQDVDRRLEGSGLRVVLTDNARSFDFDETRILVYREDDASLRAAEEVQRRLGVGTIQISRQPQSVVDLTIVVGADFVETQGGATPPPSTEEQTS